ncbi:MAG: sensor histidine kinase [Gemmatimonadales bacterium]
MPSGDRAFVRLSIAQKIPLVAGVLILLVAAAVSVASYYEVRHTARRAAYQHLDDVIQLVQSTSRRTGQQLVGEARAVAVQHSVAEYARSPNAAHAPAALSALLDRRRGGSLMATEIRAASGQVLLTTNYAVTSAPSDFPPVIADRDSGSVGTLRVLHDSIVYPVSARIPDGDGAFVVEWHHATISPEASQQQRKLLGAGTNLLLANADGGFWTDQHHRVPAPPVDLRHWSGTVVYTRTAADGPVVAGVLPLSGTPWLFALEFPLREVMAPADRFLQNVIVIALVCVALGWLAAWWFARRLTTPLVQLTLAADEIAAGRHTGEMAIRREDELGRLANSFDTMSRQIRDSRQRMEETVTERTAELHDALQQLQNAQEALVRRERLAMLGQLAGGVGHELRNPLGVMSNAIYYIEMVLESPPESVRDYLQLLKEQVALSSKIVGDLMDFSRVAPAHRSPVALRSIVDNQLRRLTDREPVCVNVDLLADDVIVEVDAVQIGQVVFNLLTNAVQAMGEKGGALKLQARRCRPDAVELLVTDSGPGIPPELMERIFEPLFTTKARGIGLGLAVSRALAQANGGDITAASDPGKGATFILTIPRAKAAMT